MYVMAVLDAIKKRGHFKDYKKAQKAYVEHKQAGMVHASVVQKLLKRDKMKSFIGDR
jgi:hypothetical protein